MNLEMFLPLQVFRIVSERYVLTPLNVWKNSPVKSSGPGLLFIGRFLNHRFNISTYNWTIHIFYFSLVRLCISLRICPFLLFFHFIGV